MSPEYRFFVTTGPKVTARQADDIQRALVMIKGVRKVLLNEVPVALADNNQILQLYLDALTSADAPPFVEGGWMRQQLPGLDKYQLREWVRQDYIDPGIPYPGYGRRRFTTEAAIKVGQIWFQIQQGLSPKNAALACQQEPQESPSIPLIVSP